MNRNQKNVLAIQDSIVSHGYTFCRCGTDIEIGENKCENCLLEEQLFVEQLMLREDLYDQWDRWDNIDDYNDYDDDPYYDSFDDRYYRDDY